MGCPSPRPVEGEDMKRILVGLVALATVGAVVFGFGPVLGGERADTKSATQLEIEFFTERVSESPADVISATRLGIVLRQNQRETGDLQSLYRAEEVLESALDALPGYQPAQLGLARVVIDLHQFERGLGLALAIDDLRLETEAKLAAGDALLALGRYDDATARFTEAELAGPSVAVDARMARLAELNGDLGEAIGIMEAAGEKLAATGAGGETFAWFATRLGDLYLSARMVDEAGAEFRRALEVMPTYAPAMAGMGDVEIARGEIASAIARYEEASRLATDPDWHFTLARLHTLAGSQEDAERQEHLALETLEVYGSIHPRDFALYYARRGQSRLARAYAEAAYAQSQDVYAHDVLAWVLHLGGDTEKALEHIEAAMALGTKEADFFYHHGAILVSLGQIERGFDQMDAAITMGLDPWDEIAARALMSTARR